MQGKKKFTPKLFVNFRLDEAVPEDNFYKILKENLDLNFIYKETESVYSHTCLLYTSPSPRDRG